MFKWRLLHDGVEVLCSGRSIDNVVTDCKFCYRNEETLDHVSLCCPLTHAVLSASPLTYRPKCTSCNRLRLVASNGAKERMMTATSASGPASCGQLESKKHADFREHQASNEPHSQEWPHSGPQFVSENTSLVPTTWNHHRNYCGKFYKIWQALQKIINYKHLVNLREDHILFFKTIKFLIQLFAKYS